MGARHRMLVRSFERREAPPRFEDLFPTGRPQPPETPTDPEEGRGLLDPFMRYRLTMWNASKRTMRMGPPRTKGLPLLVLGAPRPVNRAAAIAREAEARDAAGAD